MSKSTKSYTYDKAVKERIYKMCSPKTFVFTPNGHNFSFNDIGTHKFILYCIRMKFSANRVLHCLSSTVAVVLAVMMLASCGKSTTEPKDTPGSGSQTETAYKYEYELSPLTIRVRSFYPEFGYPLSVAVFQGTTLCDTKILSTANEKFTLKNSLACDSFTLIFQHFSGSSNGQTGGLYLISGDVADAGNGQPVNYMNKTLAAWNLNYDSLEPWFMPLDPPKFLKQTSQSDFLQGDSFKSLGKWTYSLDYSSSVIPPTRFPLRTTVNLMLTPVDGSIATRVVEYVVTETNTEGHLTATVASATPNAPPAAVTFDESAWPVVVRHLSFSNLDVLRDAKAQTSVAFTRFPQDNPLNVTFDPITPSIDVASKISLTDLNNPAAPLSELLAAFFAALDASLMELYQPLSVTPQFTVTVESSLTYTIATSPPDPSFAVTMPIGLISQYPFKPGFDDKADCLALPNPSLCCLLESSFKTFIATQDIPLTVPTEYLLKITFFGGPESPSPVLSIQNVTLQNSKSNQ